MLNTVGQMKLTVDSDAFECQTRVVSMSAPCRLAASLRPCVKEGKIECAGKKVTYKFGFRNTLALKFTHEEHTLQSKCGPPAFASYMQVIALYLLQLSAHVYNVYTCAFHNPAPFLGVKSPCGLHVRRRLCRLHVFGCDSFLPGKLGQPSPVTRTV